MCLMQFGSRTFLQSKECSVYDRNLDLCISSVFLRNDELIEIVSYQLPTLLNHKLSILIKVIGLYLLKTLTKCKLHVTHIFMLQHLTNA